MMINALRNDQDRRRKPSVRMRPKNEARSLDNALWNVYMNFKTFGFFSGPKIGGTDAHVRIDWLHHYRKKFGVGACA